MRNVVTGIAIACLVLVGAACSGGKKPDQGSFLNADRPESVAVVTGTPGTVGPVSLQPTAGAGTSAAPSSPAVGGTAVVGTSPGAGGTSVASTPQDASRTPTARPTPVSGVSGAAAVGVSSVSGKKGDTVEVVVSGESQGGTKLGGWTIDIQYDTAIAAVDSCSVGADSVCNEHFSPNTVRFVGLALDGRNGELGRIKFKLTGSAGAAGKLVVTAQTCITPTGASINCTTGGGDLRVNR